MSAVITGLQPSQQYKDTVEAMAKVGKQSPDYLRRGVSRLLEMQASVSLPLRNHLLLDAARLFLDHWQRPTDDASPSAEALLRELQALRAAATPNDELSQRLLQALESASDDTYADFGAFQTAFDGRIFDIDQATGLQEFSLWYAKYHPLLLLEPLPPQALLEKALGDRITWMTHRLHGPDEAELKAVRGSYVTHAWDYARSRIAAPE